MVLVIMVWLKLVACLVLIIIAGSKLSKYGDLIAQKTGMGRVWIGVVLLATITSLPELATGISSVSFVGKPDLTMGDLFGSNMINLAIIGVIDMAYKGPILRLLGTGVVLATVLSTLMIAVAATSLLLAQNLLTFSIVGLVGIYPLILLLLFFLAQYMIFRFGKTKQEEKTATEAGPDDISLRRVVLLFTIAGLATVGAGIWLATIGDELVEISGLKASFVGTLFLAVCTSAPEIVVSVSAARIGALEMAVSNMVGSNLFNMGVVIFADDLFYAPGPVLQAVSVGHVLTALFALIMGCVVIIGIVFHPRAWLRGWVGIDTTVLIVLYLAALAAIYFMGGI
jgi:cation:H+ antiporter